jgi:hypothetical protein
MSWVMPPEVAPGERRVDVDFGLRRRLTGTMDGLAGAKQRLDGMHAQYEHSPPTSATRKLGMLRTGILGFSRRPPQCRRIWWVIGWPEV